MIDRIGTENAEFSIQDILAGQKESCRVDAANHKIASGFMIDRLEKRHGFDSIKAIGHRIVHGMKHTDPELVTDELLVELKAISAYDPEHLPEEITLIELFRKRFPGVAQIACFDTSFHTSMPLVAKLLPIPRRYQLTGIQRYGFHGLSYAYLMEELTRIAGNAKANGRIILAQLGGGASLAAVKGGKSVDTSMGFTPTSGLPMGTRTGDIEAGLAWYLVQAEKLSAEGFNQLINHQSGMLGISETSGDMRELLKSQHTDDRAAEAVELFCYQTKKWIGSFAAVLGGVDTLVFSGGIGENAAEIRNRICTNLQFLGIELDERLNRKNEMVISSTDSKVSVYVIPTDEELMIAKMVSSFLSQDNKK